MRHPAVAEVQIVGVPSEKYGEELMAWIKTKPGLAVGAEDLEAFCRGRIATFKIPRYWKFVEAFRSRLPGKCRSFACEKWALAEYD